MVISWEESDYFWNTRFDNASENQKFTFFDSWLFDSTAFFEGRLVVSHFETMRNWSFGVRSPTISEKPFICIYDLQYKMTCADLLCKSYNSEHRTSDSSAPTNWKIKNSHFLMNCSTVQRFWRSTCEFELQNHTFRVGEALGLLFAYVICNTKWRVATCRIHTHKTHV